MIEADAAVGESTGANADAIHRLIAARADRDPDAVAIAAPGRSPLAYDGLRRHLDETVGALNALGLGRGDRVALALPDGPETAVAFLAVASTAAAAPLNPALTAAEAGAALDGLGAAALIVGAGEEPAARTAAAERGLPILELSAVGESAGLVALSGLAVGRTAARMAPGPDDVALLLHTSGTTARPKLVPLTHGNLLAGASAVVATLALGRGDRCLNVMPLFHIHGLVGALLASLAAGAAVVCPPGFVAPRFFDWLAECGPSWYTAGPTLHRAILDRAPDHVDAIAAHPLRLIRSSSAPLPPSVLAELETTFDAPVLEAYGMTEAAYQIASNPLPPRARKPGSVGVAIGEAGPVLRIAGEGGDPLPAGLTGEVAIRGAAVIAGYEGDPAANVAAFGDGWFRTGDQGYLDGDGYLFLTGRLKELINRGGEKIAPREVEEALLAHPAVAEAVAFALPDERLGEEVAAAVVARPGRAVDEGELRRSVAARLAPFKVPRRVAFLAKLPTGATGKVQRVGLADRLGLTAETGTGARAPAPFVAPRTPVEEIVAGVWAEVLRRGPIGAEDGFLALGGDSILATQVVARLRGLLGLELTVTAFLEAPTVASMAAVVDDLLAVEDGLAAI